MTTLCCAHFPLYGVFLAEDVHKNLWEKMNVDIDKDPTKIQLINACTSASTWSPEDKIRYAYLWILATLIVGKMI
ncbi:unnamed protein product [Cochlearia groenlandica]